MARLLWRFPALQSPQQRLLSGLSRGSAGMRHLILPPLHSQHCSKPQGEAKVVGLPCEQQRRATSCTCHKCSPGRCPANHHVYLVQCAYSWDQLPWRGKTPNQTQVVGTTQQMPAESMVKLPSAHLFLPQRAAMPSSTATNMPANAPRKAEYRPVSSTFSLMVC